MYLSFRVNRPSHEDMPARRDGLLEKVAEGLRHGDIEAQLSWLSWQVAGYGPMMGQAAYFNRYTPEPVPFGSWRYTAESRRLNQVLDKQLSTSLFVAGDHLTIVDIAIFVFAHSTKWCGVDINEFPNVKAWHDKLAQRPAFQKGLQVPVPYPFSDEAVSNLDG